MKKNSALIITTAIILASSVLYVSCKKKKTNEKLYEDSTSSDLSFYKGKDTIYDAKGGSPHGNFKLKFNSTAVASLGADGKLPVGGSFAEGSLIVKEVYSGNELTLYAIMKKDSKSKFASNKWVWAEYKPNGEIVYNVSLRGKACTSCHSSGTTRDLTRSFDLH